MYETFSLKRFISTFFLYRWETTILSKMIKTSKCLRLKTLLSILNLLWVSVGKKKSCADLPPCVLNEDRNSNILQRIIIFFQFPNSGYNFSGGHYNNDVAVIKIKPQRGNGFQMSRFVTPACLPTMSTSYTPGTLCQVSGWGLTDGEHVFSIISNLIVTGYVTHRFSK